MDILQVCSFAAPNAGNFIASLLALEKRMAKSGYRTIYAFAVDAKALPWCQELQKRTKVYFLPIAKARILPETYMTMARIYRENDVRIVHTHFELYDIPATVTAPKGTKIFWHLHDPVNVSGSRALLWKLQYGVVGKKAQLLSVADHYRNVVVDLGFPRAQTQTILNSISLDRIQPCETGTPDYDFLTFGWDFYRKGDDLILSACDKLWAEGYRFRLLLNGNDNTWPQLDQYLNGKPDPAYLVRGLPVEDVNQVFRASRVFIQASRRETFSYAVCEAAYAGLPVISSDIPGLEWAHSLPGVKFFPGEDIQGLYQLMKDHLDKKGTAYDPEPTRKRIREQYGLEVWVDRITEAYGLKN